MIAFLLNLFRPSPIWKETSRVYLRRGMESYCIHGTIEVDTFDYYAVTYTDVHTGQTKTLEKSVLIF
jgi:hypothetical protein